MDVIRKYTILFCGMLLVNLLSAKTIDQLDFSSQFGASKHQFSGENFLRKTGGVNQPCIILQPDTSFKNWEGGSIRFRLEVSPTKQCYLTVKFWGNDLSHNRLILFAEGKQVGYRHLGDIDVLDHGSNEPAYNDRFYYKTTPLPRSLTKGRTSLEFEIRSNGPIWGYGSSFKDYQKPMTEPSRGIYGVYTHDDGYFSPAKNEKQGVATLHPRVRTFPNEDVLEKLKEKLSREIQNQLDGTYSLNQPQMQFLAKAYLVRWTPAYENPKVIDRIIKSIDALYQNYLVTPDLAKSDQATPNPGWFGFGMVGQALWLLEDKIEVYLNQDIQLPEGQSVQRRKAYADMLRVSREWNRKHRLQYTNQSMIKDLYGIYYCNKGLAILKSPDAFDEKKVLRYLYESVGLYPWLGNDTESGSAKPLGENYYQLTGKGLTKELGFVGYYGEVLDWVAQIYDATRRKPTEAGDSLIGSQLVKISKARAAFRYPMLDEDGCRAMRVETVVGWRDTYYPGTVMYGQRMTWDGTALEAVCAVKDSTTLGFAKQMLDDNQFFKMVDTQLKDDKFRITASLLPVPDQYEWVKKNIGAAKSKLPMSWSEPDYLFTDEEDGVLALKNGKEILYVSLYWRARFAVNNLARVHYITPAYDRIAVVEEQTEFEPSGMYYTRPNWTDFGFGSGGHTYPGKQSVSVHAGDMLSIAKIPDGIKFKPGNESVFAGKAEFYSCRYGKYLIGMNCSSGKTFKLKLPNRYKSIKNLHSNRRVEKVGEINVLPLSTVVLEITD